MGESKSIGHYIIHVYHHDDISSFFFGPPFFANLLVLE